MGPIQLGRFESSIQDDNLTQSTASVKTAGAPGVPAAPRTAVHYGVGHLPATSSATPAFTPTIHYDAGTHRTANGSSGNLETAGRTEQDGQGNSRAAKKAAGNTARGESRSGRQECGPESKHRAAMPPGAIDHGSTTVDDRSITED